MSNRLEELIYFLLDKGYSKDEILLFVSTTVGRNINIEIIYRVYEITKKKWLKGGDRNE